MLGCTLVGPARDLEHARHLVATAMPHAAILDIELGLDGDQGQPFVFSLADFLADRQIPFGFVAGAAWLRTIPQRHARRPVARKPYGVTHIERLLSGLGCAHPGKARA